MCLILYEGKLKESEIGEAIVGCALHDARNKQPRAA